MGRAGRPSPKSRLDSLRCTVVKTILEWSDRVLHSALSERDESERRARGDAITRCDSNDSNRGFPRVDSVQRELQSRQSCGFPEDSYRSDHSCADLQREQQYISDCTVVSPSLATSSRRSRMQRQAERKRRRTFIPVSACRSGFINFLIPPFSTNSSSLFCTFCNSSHTSCCESRAENSASDDSFSALIVLSIENPAGHQAQRNASNEEGTHTVQSGRDSRLDAKSSRRVEFWREKEIRRKGDDIVDFVDTFL